MGATALVTPEDIVKGKEIVRALDASGFLVRSAFWFYIPDGEEWRLILATPKVDELGPRGAYATAQQVLRTLPGKIEFEHITLVSPNDPLVKLLRVAVGTPPDALADIRFTKNVINNVLIEDAYIYRSS